MIREVNLDIELSMDAHGAVDMEILGWSAKVAELAVTFQLKPGGKEKLKGVITRQINLIKTHPQLGYLFGHLAPVALAYLQECGWSTIRTKEQAVDFYKEHLGFVESHINETTGETRYELMSVAFSPREEVSQFIQDFYLEMVTAGCHVVTPEEYKKRKRYAKEVHNDGADHEP